MTLTFRSPPGAYSSKNTPSYQSKSQNKLTGYDTHLPLPSWSVFFEKHAIIAELQPVSRHPLIRRLSSLCLNSLEFNKFFAKVYLEPLVDIICRSAPTTCPLPQSAQVGLTGNARSRHGGVGNLATLEAHGCQAFRNLGHVETCSQSTRKRRILCER